MVLAVLALLEGLLRPVELLGRVALAALVAGLLGRVLGVLDLAARHVGQQRAAARTSRGDPRVAVAEFIGDDPPPGGTDHVAAGAELSGGAAGQMNRRQERGALKSELQVDLECFWRGKEEETNAASERLP